jgi:hypothetical protein
VQTVEDTEPEVDQPNEASDTADGSAGLDTSDTRTFGLADATAGNAASIAAIVTRTAWVSRGKPLRRGARERIARSCTVLYLRERRGGRWL